MFHLNIKKIIILSPSKISPAWWSVVLFFHNTSEQHLHLSFSLSVAVICAPIFKHHSASRNCSAQY